LFHDGDNYASWTQREKKSMSQPDAW